MKKCAGHCGRTTYLWSHGMCKQCWFKTHPPKPIKKSRVKPSKDKERAEKTVSRNLAYKEARLEFLETKDHCEVNLPDCLVPYPTYDKSQLQVHHMAGRMGNFLTNHKYFLCVCQNCHRYLEDHPKWAMESGYSVSRFIKDVD